MTVGLGGIFVGAANFNPNNTNNHIAQYIYAGCMFCCGGFGFLAVIIGTLRFIYYCGVPARMMDIAIACDKQIGPAEFVYVSFIFISGGSLAGAYIFFDVGIMIEFIILFIIMIILFVFIVWKHLVSFKAMGMNQGLITSERK